MKTRYKHIHFVQDRRRTEEGRAVYYCRNNKTQTGLAEISYYPLWSRWVVCANEAAVWDATRLRDIADFLDQLA